MQDDPATILAYSGRELIGDGFMKLPFLAALRGSYPDARITWLAGRGKSVYAGVLQPLVQSYLDEVIEDAGVGVSLGELMRRPLGGRAFELVIDSQRGVKTALILRRIPHRIFVTAAAHFWLSERRPEAGYRRPQALAAQLLDLVRLAAGREPRSAPRAPLPEGFTLWARAALPDGAPLLGLVPGAGGRHKCWPRERYVALAEAQRGRGVRTAFLLGPEEEGWAGELREAAPEALFPLQDARVPEEIAASPLFTLALGERLALALTNDCGTAHMLAAAGCPLVSLFGPSSAEKFAPQGTALTIIRAQDFGGSEMERIPLAAVARTVAARLAPASALNAS